MSKKAFSKRLDEIVKAAKAASIVIAIFMVRGHHKAASATVSFDKSTGEGLFPCEGKHGAVQKDRTSFFR